MTPRDADRLLVDPAWLWFACDYTRNKQFWTADARTRDFRGHRLLDSVWPLDTVDHATAWLCETVTALLDGRPVGLDPLREAEIPRPGQSPREVYIATYHRRCLSNLVSRVLAETTKALLPPNIRAYVPGLHDPVPETIKDLADAIRDRKITWWWKIDFRSFFNRIPHELIREALQHYGFTTAVADLVIACVRTPIHRRGPGGSWTSMPNVVGAPMGLAESSVLANLVCFAIDEHFERVSDRVFEVRYSDDNLGGTSIRSEGMGAVRAYRKWASANGIQIKGTSPDTRTSTLLHDIRRERMPALGAEIDQNGNIHIPRRTFIEKLAEVHEAMEAIELYGDAPIEGESLYAGSHGTDYRDIDDVRKSVEAFVSHWSLLNQYEAEHFRSLVDKRFPTLLASSGRPGTVWIASLGGPGGAEGGGRRPSAPSPETTTTTPGPGPSRARGQGPTHGPTGPDHTERRAGDSNTRTQIPVGFEVVEINDTNDRHIGTVDEDPALGIGDRTDDVEADRLIDALLGEVVGDAVVRMEDEYTSPGDTGGEVDEDPTLCTEREVCLSQVADPRPGPDLLMGTGVMDDPRSPEPPRDSVFANTVTIVAKPVPSRHGGPGALVRVLRGDVDLARQTEMTTLFAAGMRSEAALLQVIEHEVRMAAHRGEPRLDVHLERPDLPKHLIQRRNRFHQPLYFEAVVRLHRLARERGVRVRLRGGGDLPEVVTNIDGLRRGGGRRYA